MSVKVAAVVGVVIVALFVSFLALGNSKEQGDVTDGNGLVEQLAGLAGDRGAVPRSAVTAGCPGADDPNLLAFIGECTIVVRNQGELRLLRLVALSPIRIEAPAPEGELQVRADVGANEEAQVAVGEGETRVDLACRARLAVECRARLDAG